MSKFRRVFTIFGSLIMIAFALLLWLLDTDTGVYVVAIILGSIISIKGIKGLVFYLTSACHMVGGGRILINSILLLDFGALSFLVLLEKPGLAMLYLVAVFIVIGFIDILRAFEIKQYYSKRWIWKLIKGLLSIGLGILCIIFIKDLDIMITIFCIGWIINGVSGIISSFSKSAVTYIPQI